MMNYNPSSLNRNKTLLEAIEEVKNFLIANPCYKVFYANTNYVIGTTTYSKTDINDPDSMAEYDVVFFNNNYYGKVESVGDSTFTIIGATSFKGDTGAQGTPGTPGTPGADGQNGADGVSITNVSIDASNHLICTLSDGNTIDAGAIDESFKVYFTTTTSGTLTNEELAEMTAANVVNYNNSKYYYRYFEDATNLFFAYIDSYGIWKFGVNKSTGVLTHSIEKILGSGVSSGTATNGQVLTANGSGGASWETVSGGAVEGTAVLSTGETSGKVLTADGSGGASWQTAGGGGSGKYAHFLDINKSGTGVRRFKLFFTIITEDSTPYTTLAEIGTAVGTLFGSNGIVSSGEVETGAGTNVYNVIIRTYYLLSQLRLSYIDLSGYHSDYEIQNLVPSSITDHVIAL